MKKILLIPLLFSLLSCGEVTSPTSSISTNTPSSTSEVDESEVDVIILAGQSNAEGNTFSRFLSKEDISKYSAGFDNTLISYQMMGYSSNTNMDIIKETPRYQPVKLGQAYDSSRFGPEIGIAEKIQGLNRTKPVYMIKFASGGTDLYRQWASPSSGTAGDRYARFENFVDLSLGTLINSGYNPKIKAMCWMQGETDAIDSYKANIYEKRLEAFILDIEDRFSDCIGAEGLTFIDATIFNGTYSNGANIWAHHLTVNSAKENVASKRDNWYCIDTNEAELTTVNEPETIDYYHYDAECMVELGHLFGDVLINNSIIK